MYHLSKEAAELNLRKNFKSFKLSCDAGAAFPEARIGVGLLSANCTQMTVGALEVEWNMPYTKGEEPMLESAGKGERTTSPDTNMDLFSSSFSLSALSLGGCAGLQLKLDLHPYPLLLSSAEFP